MLSSADMNEKREEPSRADGISISKLDNRAAKDKVSYN
jgi:hypothetical protein